MPVDQDVYTPRLQHCFSIVNSVPPDRELFTLLQPFTFFISVITQRITWLMPLWTLGAGPIGGQTAASENGLAGSGLGYLALQLHPRHATNESDAP